MAPTTKQELLDEIEHTHQDLVRVLASMSDAEQVAPILDEGWSVKDSLAHLVAWEKMTIDWLTHSLQGESVKRYIPGYIYETPAEQEPVMLALNQHLYEQDRDRPLADIRRDFRRTHQAILDLVAQMDERDIFDANRFAWRNGSPALDLIAGNTYEHYSEHQGWILEAFAKHPNGIPAATSVVTASAVTHAAEPALLAPPPATDPVELLPPPPATDAPELLPATAGTSAAPPPTPQNEIAQLMSLLSTPGAAKTELLSRIQGRHSAMAQLLSRLSVAQMTAPELDAGWSVKDSLAHITAWENMMLDWFDIYERGEDVIRWAPGFEIVGGNGEEQMNRYNAYLFEKNKDLPLEQVLDEFRAAYAQVVARISGMSEAEIFDPGYFPVRNGRPLITLIVGDSYEHYDEHIGWIRAWREKRASKAGETF